MLLYLCPALMDTLHFLVFFAMMYGAGERGMSVGQCAWLGNLPPIVYAVCCVLVGRALTPRNAGPLALWGTAICVAGGVAGVLWLAFWPLLAASAALGFGAAWFYNAFQAFMRSASRPEQLPRMLGLYTLAWSLGGAVGFFSSGTLYTWGRPTLAALTALIGGTIALILYARARVGDLPGAAAETPGGVAGAPVTPPRYVWIGWIGLFAMCFIQRPIMTFFPALAAQEGVSSFHAGLPLCAHMALLGCGGPVMARLTTLLHRPGPILACQGAAALALLALWQGRTVVAWLAPLGVGAWVHPTFGLACAGLALLGLYGSFASFSSIYYVSHSARRAFNVGVNECLGGLGALVGTLVCQAWIERVHSAAVMYLVCALALLTATAAQGLLAQGSERRRTDTAHR